VTTTPAARLFSQGLDAARRVPDRAVRQLAAADALLQAAGTGWLVAYAATAPSNEDTLP
jgi:hypothetical protein